MSGSIHFSGNNRQVPDYVLNSPRENVFEKNNIRFRIGGQYLTDFSDKGIKNFIKENYNSKSGFLGSLGLGWGGKDLEFKEVKAFIQATAANADKLQGATFELTDPELGLFDDDDIQVRDIQHSFSLQFKDNLGKSSQEVSFVDVTSASYDYRSATQAEKKAGEALKSVEKQNEKLVKGLADAIQDRDKIADRIGGDALKKLAEIDGRLADIDSSIGALDKDMRAAEARLSQGHIEPAERRELSLALRGMKAEREDLIKDKDKLNKELKEKHGFWSFLGGGSTLEDLRKANRTVEQARKNLDDFKSQLDEARAAHERAIERRKAVEEGKSLAELDADEKPIATPTPANPDAPSGAADIPAAPTGPSDPAAPTAPPDLALEQEVQKLLTTPVEQQLEALSKIPPEKRAAFLQIADDYILAAQPENPLGLPPADFDAVKQLKDHSSALRLNALLSWPDSQDEYLSQRNNRIKQQLLAQLNEQRFAQQLANQAQALKAKLEATAPKEELISPPAAEEVVAPPAVPASPTAPPAIPSAPPSPATPAVPAPPQAPAADAPPVAPAVPTAPVTGAEPFPPSPTPPVSEVPAASLSPTMIDLNGYMQLPKNEQLQRFRDLSPVDQDRFFKALGLQDKADVLLAVTTQQIDNQEMRARLIASLGPEEKGQIATFYQSLLQGIAGQAFSQTTELNMLIGELGGKAVVAPLAAAPTPPAASVAPAADPAPVAPAADPAPAAPVSSTPARPLSSADLAAGAPDSTPVLVEEPAAPKSTAPKPSAPAFNAAAFVDLPAEEALDKFPKLTHAQQKEVFKLYNDQARTEILLALTLRTPDEGARDKLIKSMTAAQKQASAQILMESLPSVQGYPDVAAGMTSVLNALGIAPDQVQPATAPVTSPSAAPTSADPPDSQGVVDLGQLEIAPTGSDQATPPALKLDLSAELGELNKQLQNKTYFGYGGVADPAKVSELAEKIWVNGTPANRNQLAKTLVNNGQAAELGRILGNLGVTDEEVLAVVTQPQFPASRFMKDIDDNRSFLILYSLAKAAANGNKPAQNLISSTIDQYMIGIDREKPIKRLKNQAMADGIWNKMPQEIRTKADKMLSSWWN